MKAKVIETGKIVNVVPMDGNWCDPSETRYYSDKELDFSLVTDGWDAYRREAAKEAMLKMLMRDFDTDAYPDPQEVCGMAVLYADELIKQLQGK